MDTPEKFIGSRDRSHVIKRHSPRRLASPHGTPAMAASSSSSIGGDCSISAAAGEDDEDMANCLILLAQGDGPNDHEDLREESSGEKSENMISSVVRTKKVSELGVVYECKTCGRVFPSFQALGGHRASHSKPNKGTGTLEVQNRARDHDQDQGRIYRTATISPGLAPARPGKVHRCSICSSKFASGQALGGHMRRHRSSSVNGDDAAAVSATADDSSKKPRKFLQLDLNLPAQEDEDEEDSIFGCGPGQPVPPLLFSATALVDCHY